MKKLKYLLFLLLIIPFNVKALYFNIDDDIKEEKEINESAIIVGEDIDVKNKVDGINLSLGNNIKLNGNSEYLVTVGNNLNISGNVLKDSFILGNIIKLNNINLKRDLVVLGNEVEISGEINGKILVLANKVTVKGNYNNVSIKSGNIIIDGNIKKLEHNEDAKLEKLNQSTIEEIVTTDKIKKDIDLNVKMMNFISDFGGTLFMFLAIYLIVPCLFKRVEENNKDITLLNMFSFFGFGTLSVILIPVIFILLISLFFGIQFAFLLLILYFIALWLSTIFTGYLIGDIIWNKFIKKNKNPLLVGLLGISIIKILSFIPGIGYLITSISIMIGMGIILQQFKRD